MANKGLLTVLAGLAAVVTLGAWGGMNQKDKDATLPEPRIPPVEPPPPEGISEDVQLVNWQESGWYQSRLWDRNRDGSWYDKGASGMGYSTLAGEADLWRFREGGTSRYLKAWKWDGVSRAWVKVYSGAGIAV
jgi:hypothetical protein